MWICNMCHAKNKDEHNFCGECGAARPESATSDNGEEKIGYDSGAGLYHEAGNESAYTDNGEDKNSFGSWKCECGRINKNSYNFCFICGKQKPKESLKKPPVDPPEASGKTGGGEKEPLNKTLIICITAVIIALILLAAVAISSKSKNTYYSPSVSSNGHTAVTQTPDVPVDDPEAEQWGEWSTWSTTPRYASSTVQVEQRQNTRVLGYYMVHYGTQEAKSPYNRMFRNYSIKDDLDRYGARASYGEKHLTKYVSINDISQADAYPANGDMVEISYGGKVYRGYQMGTDTAYNFGDDKYLWFIESEDSEIITEYRYRERK